MHMSKCHNNQLRLPTTGVSVSTAHQGCMAVCLQVLSGLSRNMQLAIFTEVQLPLCSLMRALPPALHAALILRHFHPGDASLDISNQLHAYTQDGVQRYPVQMLTPHLTTLFPLRHLDASHNSLCAGDVSLVATLVNMHASEL